MIAYKIVYVKDDSKKRYSWAVCSNDLSYRLKYPKGEIVHAIKGSQGIYCFKTLKEARAYDRGGGNKKILQVKTIGRKNEPRWQGYVNDIVSFYRNPISGNKTLVDKGSICYPAVKVLT